MTHEEFRRRVEAVHRWVQAHHADPNPPCPTCGGIKWDFRVVPLARYVPRVCMSCGHVQSYDAKLLGLGPAPVAERFEAVLAAYLEALNAGWAPPRSQLLACYPELAPELGAFFANTDRVAEAVRSAAGVPRPATGATGNGDNAP